MSTDRLREAARVLRERAEATTWAPECGGWWLPFVRSAFPVAEADVTVAEARDGGTAAYIATMHPGVGLALADWLDNAAEDDEQQWGRLRDFDAEGISARIADLILGGTR